jgi:DNA-directed RNA polymerase specialized sigma24 family protein
MTVFESRIMSLFRMSVDELDAMIRRKSSFYAARSRGWTLADDAAQDTWMEITHLVLNDSVLQIESPQAWLSTVIKRKMSKLTKTSVPAQVLENIGVRNLPERAPEADPTDKVMLSDEHRYLYRQLDHLPPVERDAVRSYHRFPGSPTPEETAALHGIGLRRLRQIKSTALKSLRRRFAEEFGVTDGCSTVHSA